MLPLIQRLTSPMVPLLLIELLFPLLKGLLLPSV